MKLKVFTVYDSKTEAYLNPIFCRSTGEAIRSFTDIANDKTSQIGKYPSDFTIFEIGEYDQLKGEMCMLETKKSLGLALEYQKN